MSNMGYCRMENTYNDLKDCYDNWDDIESDSEEQYREKILKLCYKIIENFGEPSCDCYKWSI